MSILDVEFFEEPKAAPEVQRALSRLRAIALQRRQACVVALPAMQRLSEVLKCRSGQPYKLRALLYSLWNGKPASLLEIVSFDWEIRQDLLLVLAAFGYEDSQAKFFYKTLEMAIRAAGEWDWFLEEQHNVELLKEYVEAAARRAKEEL